MSTWHPILAAVEGPTGTWRMIDTLDHEYGRIEIRRVMSGTDVRYRASHKGEVIGWATTLREACERVHDAFLRAHSPGFRSGAPQDWELEQLRRRGLTPIHEKKPPSAGTEVPAEGG